MKIQRPDIKVNKTWLMLAVAIVLSLLTTWLTLQYLKHKEESIEAEVAERTKQERGATIAVAVPTKNYPAGVVLEENMVASRNVPADFLTDDAITADQFDAYKGQVLLRPVVRGKPLRKPDLQPVFADFSDTLKDGKRAMTINVDELNSVSHMIEPGNLVDLLLALSGSADPAQSGGATHGTSNGQTVVPFMDQVKVLATGQKITHDAPADGPEKRKFSYSNLTLEVTPAQAARLTLAMDIGKIRAVLRNEKDKQDLDFDSITAGNLLEDVRERARRAALARPPEKAADGAAPRRSSVYVEYIIGGRGGSNDVTTQAQNVAIPGMSGLSALNSAMAYEQQANAAALGNQLGGSLGESAKQGVSGAPAKSSK